MDIYPRISGWNTSSEAGPDNFAPSVFLGGCNYRCAYCMNAKLVLDHMSLKEVDIQDIEEFVTENKCEWINISGGEPTLQNTLKLTNMILEFKRWGCKIAMSTNGSFPDKLVMLLPFINYITMDLKTSITKYWDVEPSFPKGGLLSPISNVLTSLHLLRTKKRGLFEGETFDYEVRTTLYRPLVGEKEMEEMSFILRSDEKWVLQPFRQARNMIDPKAKDVEPYSDEELDKLFKIATEKCNNVKLRNV